MTIYYVILLFMTLLGSVASLLLKRASSATDILELVKNTNFYAGGFLYFFSAVLNIYILRYLDYSVVLPLTSFTYIWTMILSYYILKERKKKKKILGVLLIISGAAAVSL